jgi:murein DD-endopeptidase MepM/ murein hydrolase activator NlpD
LNFTRISSNFNPSRRHPVLNTIRAHRGVDYAAPSGTPIRAAGDGKVLFRGVQGGYGNTIILQHGGNITTLYGHLSRFASARAGARVKQGDVIGYVGKTGLATGPHLHYEYRVSGVHRNPRTVALPPADPIPPELQATFMGATDSLWHQLDNYTRADEAAPALPATAIPDAVVSSTND